MSRGQRIGYVRVSTLDQSTARQLDGVELDRVFEDKASGGSTDRPQLKAMLDFVREGDTVFVHSLDRLARNLVDLRSVVQGLNERGVKVEFVKNGLTFAGNDSPTSTLLLSMLGAVAEFERAMIRERQREGIDKAKERGAYQGRKPSLTNGQVDDLRKRAAAGEPKAKLAKEFGISRATVYTYLSDES